MAVARRENHVLLGFRTAVEGDLALERVLVGPADARHLDFHDHRTRLEVIRVGKALVLHPPRRHHHGRVDAVGARPLDALRRWPAFHFAHVKFSWWQLRAQPPLTVGYGGYATVYRCLST